MLCCGTLCNVLLHCQSLWVLNLRNLGAVVSNWIQLFNDMGISRYLMPVDVPRSVSVCAAEINVVVHAGSNGVLCCDMCERKSILEMLILNNCHQITGFLLWLGSYCMSCVFQKRNRVRNLFSLFSYDDSCSPRKKIRCLEKRVQTNQTMDCLEKKALLSNWKQNDQSKKDQLQKGRKRINFCIEQFKNKIIEVPYYICCVQSITLQEISRIFFAKISTCVKIISLCRLHLMVKNTSVSHVT